jgi:hypothetical protein
LAVLILFERRSDLLLQSGGGATERMDQNEKKENIGYAVHHGVVVWRKATGHTQNGAQTRHTFEIIGLVGFYCLVLASSLNSMFLLLPVFCSQSPCCHRDRLIAMVSNEDRETVPTKIQK